MPKAVDHTGKTFGRLIATERLARKGQHTRYRCTCECGSEVVALGYSLVTGNTRSCGCLYDSAERGENISKATVKHGGTSKHADPGVRGAHISWRSMIARATNPNYENFHRYGGRGITVCPEWLSGFEQFLADMGPRPVGHSIERKNNDLGYCRENCEWANPLGQGNNRSTNLHMLFDGRTQTGAEWTREVGLPRNVIYKRLGAGWGVEKALTTPLHKRRPYATSRAYCFNATLFGLSPFTAALLTHELKSVHQAS